MQETHERERESAYTGSVSVSLGGPARLKAEKWEQREFGNYGSEDGSRVSGRRFTDP